jgi:Trypsin
MRLKLGLTLVFALLCVVLPSSAGAIIGGQPDGTNHPYVAYADNGVFACSGTLLSPTVMLTAAHCFSDSTSAYGTNTVTGGSIVRTTFDPDLTVANPTRHWYWGTYYFDPDFAIGSAGGLPGFDTHDVAVIVFTSAGCNVPLRNGLPRDPALNTCGPIPGSATNNQYGQLPSLNLVDTLANQTPVDLVGYGVRNYIKGGGPCGGPCTPVTGDVFTRYFGQANVFKTNGSIGDEFLKLHANKVGVCHGDSGGPDLLAGTNIILAVNSFGNGTQCQSNTYSYRVDTQEALTEIAALIAAGGGSL